MQNDTTTGTNPSRQTPVAVLRVSGIGYGIFFGLGLALCLWGYDAYLLSRASIALAWGQFLIGLPCALLVCGVTGHVGARLPAVGWTTVLWAIVLGALTWLAGHGPFQGFNFLTGVVDPRFAGFTLRPYLEANQMRTLFAIIPNVVLGFAVGYLETLMIEVAWDHTDAHGRMGWRSWGVLLSGFLIAVIPALIIQALVMEPVRRPQLHVANLIATTLEGGVAAVQATGQNSIEAENYGPYFTPSYTVQLAEFSTLTKDLHTSYVTVVFDNGFALQCIVMGDQVTFCEDLTKIYTARIGALAYAGMTGEQRWLSDPRKIFSVADAVVAWLREHRGRFSENYRITRIEPKGPITLVTAQFDTSFRMTCRFSGVALTHTILCEEN